MAVEDNRLDRAEPNSSCDTDEKDVGGAVDDDADDDASVGAAAAGDGDDRRAGRSTGSGTADELISLSQCRCTLILHAPLFVRSCVCACVRACVRGRCIYLLHTKSCLVLVLASGSSALQLASRATRQLHVLNALEFLCAVGDR